MPEPTLVEQPQVAAEAVLGKKIATGTAMTPEQELAEKVRKKVAEDIAPRQVAEGMTPHPPPTESRVNFVNNENIGTRRKGGDGEDAGNKEYADGSSSEKFRKSADAHAKLAQQMLSMKYEDIRDESDFAGSGMSTKDYLVKQFMDAAYSWPEGRAVLEAYGTGATADAARRAKIEELFLKNPQMLKKLGARFGEVYDGENAVFADMTTNAREVFIVIEKKYGLKKKEVDDLVKEQRANTRSLKEYRPGGTEYASYGTNKKDQPKHEALAIQKTREIERARRKIDELQKQRYHNVRNPETGAIERLENPAVAGQISDIETKEIDPAQSDLDIATETLGKIKAFEEIVVRLEKQNEEIAEKLTGSSMELADLDLERSKARSALDVAMAARVADEEQFTNNVQGMFKEAGMRFMKEEAQRYEAAQAKIAEKAVKEAVDNDEKHIQNAMKNKWREDEKKGRRTISKVNKREVRYAYDQLIKDRNADYFVKQFMEQGWIDARNKYGAASIQAQEERRRLDEKYKDSDFMKRMNVVVSERLLKNYLESGGKVRSEDASIIVETEWGASAIDAAIAKNAETDKLITHLKNENAFPGSKSEFLKALVRNPGQMKTAGIGIAGLLALIFGAPFLVAGLGAVGGAYSAAVGAVS